MTSLSRARHRLPGILLGCTLAATGLAACSNDHPAGTPTGSAPGFATSLATSIPAPGGSWATVPMGTPGQPLNTFWQLFFRPANGSAWANQVQSTAVATNGGLVLASGAGTVLVGVRPSNKLTFSPLLSTVDDGTSWSSGLVDEGLAARPSALAVGPAGRALALVAGSGGPQVVSSPSAFANWSALATTGSLSATGRACGPVSLTAVAYLGGSPVVGAACTRPGSVGMFVQGARGFRLADLPLPDGLATSTTEVLGLWTTPVGLAALVGARSDRGWALLACWGSPNDTWAVSAPVPLASRGEVGSIGLLGPSGIFVVLHPGAGAPRALTEAGPGATWDELPPPPPDTTTLASVNGVVQALAVSSETSLTVSDLDTGSTGWSKTQVIDVPIQFGSSG